MDRKRILKSIIFVALVALLVVYLFGAFRLKDSNGCRSMFDTFYGKEENTVDLLHTGTSATSRYLLVPEMYKESGIAAYLMATDGQPFVMTEYLIREALKTQSPQLIVIELRNVSVYSDKGFTEGLGEDRIRRVVDSMKFSQNKIETIDAALEDARVNGYDIDFNRWNYIFSFSKYHSRWSQDISVSELLLKKTNNSYQGTVLRDRSFTVKPFDMPEFTEDSETLPSNRGEIMESLLDYCDSLDCHVLFVASPYMAKEQDQLYINAAAEMAKDRGYPVVNCLSEEMIDEIGLDTETDYYNSKHVNMMGAYKYTKWFTDYLTDHYDLPDRRNDSSYDGSCYEEDYERMLQDTEDRLQELEESCD